MSNLINRDGLAKLLKIKNTDVSVLRIFCSHFPEKIMIKNTSYCYLEDAEKWLSKYNPKQELRKAMKLKQDKYREYRLAYDHIEVYKPINPALQLHITSFLSCHYAKWRQYRNREIYKDYLVSEKLQQKLKFSRRIGL